MGAGATMPVTTPPRYAPAADETTRPQTNPKRTEDLDVPTFIRKKAD